METLSDLREQAQRLTKFTKNVLILNRLHPMAQGMVSMVSGDADFLDVADDSERTLSGLAPTIAARGWRVETNYAPTSCDAFASAAHLCALIRNLIENAVRYADANGWPFDINHEAKTITALVTFSNKADVNGTVTPDGFRGGPQSIPTRRE